MAFQLLNELLYEVYDEIEQERRQRAYQMRIDRKLIRDASNPFFWMNNILYVIIG